MEKIYRESSWFVMRLKWLRTPPSSSYTGLPHILTKKRAQWELLSLTPPLPLTQPTPPSFCRTNWRGCMSTHIFLPDRPQFVWLNIKPIRPCDQQYRSITKNQQYQFFVFWFWFIFILFTLMSPKVTAIHFQFYFSLDQDSSYLPTVAFWLGHKVFDSHQIIILSHFERWETSVMFSKDTLQLQERIQEITLYTLGNMTLNS